MTAVNFSDTAEQIISGGIDNDIKVFNILEFAKKVVLCYYSTRYPQIYVVKNACSFVKNVYFCISNGVHCSSLVSYNFATTNIFAGIYGAKAFSDLQYLKK